MPPVINSDFTGICQQDYDMCCARTDFVIAARTTICLDSSGRGDRSHLVPITVGPGFDPAVNRQRP
jgi:hypothetical protein